MQPYLYGAEARAVTHKPPRTEAEIREETVPGLPIIRAEVYGWRELQGITEIKLHRRGNIKYRRNFPDSAQNDGARMSQGKKERYRSSVRERCIATNPISIMLSCPQTHHQESPLLEGCVAEGIVQNVPHRVQHASGRDSTCGWNVTEALSELSWDWFAQIPPSR